MNELKLNTNKLEQTEAEERGSMTDVVMKKSALLNKLIENRAKHDAVLEIAINGYWEEAKQRINIKEKDFYEKLTKIGEDARTEFDLVKNKIDKKETLPIAKGASLISIDTDLKLQFPVDHSKDYDLAISMMDASIHDTVRLTAEEFNCFVMNEWSWKASFLATNTVFALGSSTFSPCSGTYIMPPNITGAVAETYTRARQEAGEKLLKSKVISF